MKKILFVVSEAVPFLKTGGLGEVTGSLPKALHELGHDVRVILPKYSQISSTYLNNLRHKANFTVPVTWRKLYCGIEYLEFDGIKFYFIDNEYYFKRDGVYGYYDEAERFVFFCRAVLEGLAHLDFKPDILHCHDWQSGLVPLLLAVYFKDKLPYRRLKTVFTIHNLKYQGIFTHWILDNILGLGNEYFTPEKLEHYGQVNLMKAGIVYCDRLTTVSRTYAQEIKYPFFGEGLDGLIRQHEGKLRGILNGLDYEEYNPETDRYLEIHYKDSLEQKSQNKLRLQASLGLTVGKDIPMLGMVTRLTEQKGLDLLIHILEEALTLELQLVILGAGDQKYESILAQTACRYPEKFKVKLGFDEGLARRIYASADLFLMPSLFEPCGLSQLIALRYGALPVVRETGGLKDTVLPYNHITGEGNGFSFSNYNAHDFLFTIKRALEVYHNKKAWAGLVQAAVNANFSWRDSAGLYSQLYEEL